MRKIGVFYRLNNPKTNMRNPNFKPVGGGFGFLIYLFELQEDKK